MLDLTAIRMFYLDRIADDPFTLDDEKALAAVVLEYGHMPDPNGTDGLRLTAEETIYLLESFGYDVGTLQISKRQFLAGLLPHYSMASKHPLLVGQIYRILSDPEYRQRMVRHYDDTHPVKNP